MKKIHERLLKNEGIVIESKITREKHGQKEIGDELIVDKNAIKVPTVKC